MTQDEEIKALKAALVQADLDYQDLSEKYGEALERKKCGCERMEGITDSDD